FVIKESNLILAPKILVDGKFCIPKYKIEQEAVIKGDGKSASIAAASILAKVERDELMLKLAENFPQYEWHKNKGYPTPFHLAAIQKFGICEHHRKTFLTKYI
ncbi:MAG: ribonuclease HII, partial [Candidatus Gastranaerophilales bacterium]|nr:ribonuclease HII [Candidatus Gastranaerophilales bacterium]